jgi:hypothetical protein
MEEFSFEQSSRGQPCGKPQNRRREKVRSRGALNRRMLAENHSTRISKFSPGVGAVIEDDYAGVFMQFALLRRQSAIPCPA